MKTRHQVKLEALSSLSLSNTWNLNLSLSEKAISDDLKILSSIPQIKNSAASPTQSKSTQQSMIKSLPEMITTTESKDKSTLKRTKTLNEETIKKEVTSDSDAIERFYTFCKDLWDECNLFTKIIAQRIKQEEVKDNLQDFQQEEQLPYQYEVPKQEVHSNQNSYYSDHINSFLYDSYTKYLTQPTNNSQIHVVTAYKIYQAVRQRPRVKYEDI